jgi:S1-C subfamily serine protease
MGCISVRRVVGRVKAFGYENIPFTAGNNWHTCRPRCCWGVTQTLANGNFCIFRCCKMTRPRGHTLLGITGRTALVSVLATLVLSVGVSNAAEISSGSGVVIGVQGEILTNAHVIDNCSKIMVRSSAGGSTEALLLAGDEKNDLAVIQGQMAVPSVAAFRDDLVRAGEQLWCSGIPCPGCWQHRPISR